MDRAKAGAGWDGSTAFHADFLGGECFRLGTGISGNGFTMRRLHNAVALLRCLGYKIAQPAAIGAFPHARIYLGAAIGAIGLTKAVLCALGGI